MTSEVQTVKTWYAVTHGRTSGVFTSWKQTEEAVIGFAGARFKGFKTLEAANLFLMNESVTGLTGSDVHDSTSDSMSEATFDKINHLSIDDSIVDEKKEIDQLTDEQSAALIAYTEGKNLFVTGPAGTGKSFLITAIRKWSHEADRTLAVTASTGAAALLIGGRTLHSWAGIGLGNGSVAALMSSYMALSARKRIVAAHSLLIDEISMINDELFDKLDEYLQLVRRCVKPFGGMQLIVVGDFTQLPPVSGRFAFQSRSWNSVGFMMVRLSQQIRQGGDVVFKEMLERLRWGRGTQEDLLALQKTSEHSFGPLIRPTKIFPMNRDVDRINKRGTDALIKVGAKMVEYPLRGVAASLKWAKSLRVDESIGVCVGAQVMCTMNIPSLNLVNGSRGTVIETGFSSVTIQLVDGEFVEVPYQPIVNEENRKIHFNVMPLRLAFACSAHRAQGATLDCAEIDLGRVFAAGQAYVMLSRVRNLSDVRVLNPRLEAFFCDASVGSFYEH